MSARPLFLARSREAGWLPYIRHDGERNPEINRGTDRAALGRLVDAVDTLALAYYFTRHEPYASSGPAGARLFSIRHADEPEPRVWPIHPGVNNGRGIASLRLAFRRTVRRPRAARGFAGVDQG